MDRFLVLNKETKAIVNPNLSYPPDRVEEWLSDLLDPQIGGLDPSLEIVCVYEPYSIPPVDTRLVNIITTEVYSSINHPVYPSVKQWLITYTTQDKPVLDKKEAVDIQENQANETTIPYEKRLKSTTLAVWTLMKYLNLQTNTQINATALSNKDKKRLRLFRVIALKIDNNDNERDNKYALIDANSNPDIDANWDLNNYIENV